MCQRTLIWTRLSQLHQRPHWPHTLNQLRSSKWEKTKSSKTQTFMTGRQKKGNRRQQLKSSDQNRRARRLRRARTPCVITKEAVTKRDIKVIKVNLHAGTPHQESPTPATRPRIESAAWFDHGAETNLRHFGQFDWILS